MISQVSTPSGQYLVDAPVAAVTALSLCGNDRLAHLDTSAGTFPPFFPARTAEVWPSPRPLQNLHLVVSEPSLRSFGWTLGVAVLPKEKSSPMVQFSCRLSQIVHQDLVIFFGIHVPLCF